MEFKRKKKRGMDQRFEKVWFSDGHQYRITWSRRVFGVAVTPHYHACVLSGDRWEFAGRRGPYKKLNTAVDACEKHRKVWEAALEMVTERKGRTKKLENLFEKTGPILRAIPAWAEKEHRDALRIVKAVLFPEGRRVEEEDECCDSDQNDPSNLSQSSEPSSPSSCEQESSTTLPSGPAPSAWAEAGTTTQTTSQMSSKATSSETESSAQPATASVQVPKRLSKRSTPGSSKTGKRKSKSSTGKKRSAKAA